MAANVQPIIEPDPEQMHRHLEHLFGGELDGCHDGLIEISWTHHQPDAGGRYPLRHARLFRTDEIDEAVAEAAKQNRVPNQNVYVGAALRKPDTAPFGRATDEDFYALTAFYCDLDDEAAAATAKGKYEHCRPTMVVVTGRHPHTRAQCWWRLETPERDPRAARAQNEAIATALSGDPVVINPSRVMRLAGTIAWPTKPGRQLERTDLVEFSDGRPKMYVQGAVERAFPAAPLLNTPPDIGNPIPPLPTPSFDPATGEIVEAQAKPNFEAGRLSVDATVEAILSGREWHNNVIRLVAHWCNRGWTDTEILLASSALTLPGWTVAQTRAEVAKAIEGARRKYRIPNPVTEVEPAEPRAALTAAPLMAFDPAAIPPRPWVLGRRLLRGIVTLTIAPGGVGKSLLTLQEGISIVTGMPIAGQKVHHQGRAWIYNNEDPLDEIKRRIAAICAHFDIDLRSLVGGLFVNSGFDRRLIVARKIREAVVQEPDVDACIEEIRRNGIVSFTVDPFVSTHKVGESANEEIDEVGRLYAKIAYETGCAVNLVHHTRKPPSGSSEGHAGNLDSSRGAGSLGNVARLAYTLATMAEKDADRYGIAEKERRYYVRLDDAKANLAAPAENCIWFRKESVMLSNGDEVGVLRMEELTVDDTGEEDANRALRQAIVSVLSNGESQSVNVVAERILATGKVEVTSKSTLRRKITNALGWASAPTLIEDENGQPVKVWKWRTDASKETSPIWIRKQTVA